MIAGKGLSGQVAPGLLVVAGFGVEQPALDVFAGRALRCCRAAAVEIDRALGAPRAGAVGQRRAGVERDGKGLFISPPPCSSSSICGCSCRPAPAAGDRCPAGFLPNRWAKRFCGRRYSSTGTRRRILVDARDLAVLGFEHREEPVSLASRASGWCRASRAPAERAGHQDVDVARAADRHRLARPWLRGRAGRRPVAVAT
jgi:hypothetical protein